MADQGIPERDWKKLADAIVRPGDQASSEWSEQDLAQMLNHQLSLHIGDAGHGSPTVGQLLSEACPTLADLQWVKAFAKEGGQAHGPPPPEIAAVLYYGAIAVAWIRLSTRISGLVDPQILAGVEWVLGRSWLDERTRASFKQLHADIAFRIERR